MSGLIDDLKESIDDILSVREDLGAVIEPVALVTRTWLSSEVGDGSFTDHIVEMHPTPGIKDLSHSYRVEPGGAVQAGDILLKMISKASYPLETDVNCVSTVPNVEKFYRVGQVYYRVISVKSDYVTWDVQLRRLTDQSRRNA